MSQISLKSISGITSITTPTGVDNQLTLHTNNTNQAFKLDSAGNIHVNNHVNITGVSSASNFKTGSSNLHSSGLSAASIDVGSNIKLGNAGVVTATSFTGSGANLTNLPVPTTITVADESTDTTCNPLFVTTTSGNLAPKTGTNLTFNSSSGNLRTSSLFLGTGSNESKTQDGLILERNSGDGEVHITAGRSGGNYSGMQFYVAGASGVTKRHLIDYQSNFRWYGADGTTEMARLNSSGNLMIGMTNGSKKFSVKEASTSSGVYYNQLIGGSSHLAGYAVGIGFDPEGYPARTKIGIVAEGVGAGYSKGKLHFLLDSANDSGEATLSESRMTINDTGQITTPYQPSFYATANSGGTVSMTSTHVLTNWRLSTSGRTYDIGSNFNTSNGRFTAPITGKYLFTGSILLAGYDQASGIHVMWRKNGSTFQYWYNTRTSDIDRSGYGGYLAQGSTTTMSLDANDYIEVACNFGGSLSLWCGDANWGHWSGHFLG